MIFLTVGQCEPFDRLVRVVDTWARENGREDVFAQVGQGGEYAPKHMNAVELLEPDEFRSKIDEADLVISHAGMGTILTVMQAGKPMLVMPRLVRFHETRNDHQVASAEAFRKKGSIATARDEDEVLEKLRDLPALLRPSTRIGASASDTLLASVRSFIHGERPNVIVRTAEGIRRKAA